MKQQIRVAQHIVVTIYTVQCLAIAVHLLQHWTSLYTESATQVPLLHCH